jgi:sugar phosphate isomerase/epimerase
VYHWGHEPSILRQLPGFVSKIGIVQLGDAKQPPCGDQNRCRLGEGSLPLKEITGILIDAGYNGFYDVELVGEDLENSDYGQLIEQSKQAFFELISGSSLA